MPTKPISDGQADAAEVAALLGLLGETYSAPERMLAMGDRDEDGRLTAAEFGSGSHHIRHTPTDAGIDPATCPTACWCPTSCASDSSSCSLWWSFLQSDMPSITQEFCLATPGKDIWPQLNAKLEHNWCGLGCHTDSPHASCAAITGAVQTAQAEAGCTSTCTAQPTNCEEFLSMSTTGCASTCPPEVLAPYAQQLGCSPTAVPPPPPVQIKATVTVRPHSCPSRSCPSTSPLPHAPPPPPAPCPS